jgi:hypothetical protein
MGSLKWGLAMGRRLHSPQKGRPVHHRAIAGLSGIRLTCRLAADGMPAHDPHDPRMTSRPLWWLTYRRDGELAGVVIVEGQALIDARMQASLKGLEDGVAFAEGHQLASKAMVPAKAIGRMLSIAEAKTVLTQIDGRSR